MTFKKLNEFLTEGYTVYNIYKSYQRLGIKTLLKYLRSLQDFENTTKI